jgi:hypothetical protein
MSSLDPSALRLTIQHTLIPINQYSADVEELLMATAANESNLGYYRQQVGGPALGIFQMEPEDHDDAWQNYIKYHTDLVVNLKQLSVTCAAEDLINNDPYAIAMARVHYLRCPGTIPAASDIEAIWDYYKRFYNTPDGAATHDEFISKYNRYVLGQNS